MNSNLNRVLKFINIWFMTNCFFLTMMYTLIPTIFCKAQKAEPVFEQTAFNYFLDSIYRLNYPEIKTVYYNPKINSTPSLLRRPSGFKDYIESKDSLEISKIRMGIDSIKRLDLSYYKLTHEQIKNLTLIELPKKRGKINWKKSIRIEVFKRNVAVKDFYIVELVATDKSLRFHYFIELNKSNGTATRWYVSKYFF